MPLSSLFKFFIDVICNQFSLYHGDQVALIVWYNESIWTTSPSASLNKIEIKFAMFLDCWIEHDEWPTVENKFRHYSVSKCS